LIVTRAVTADMKVRLGAIRPSPPSEVLDRVEAIWEAEKAKRPKALFNGSLFSIDDMGATEITGWLAEYRWFLAQRRDPALRPFLRVNPLGVTGVLCCADGVVLGRRAGNVEMDAGLWELAPSGGVDGSVMDANGEIDLRGHLLTELNEEIGVSEAKVTAPPQPVLSIEDKSSYVTDIAFIIETSMSGQKIIRHFEGIENREYVELNIIPVSNLLQYADNLGDSLAPVSRSIILETAAILMDRN
jgi:hypothetical protein